MLNKLKQLREANEEGFTLIELLVVIVIIGILAAIALPIFLNQQKAAMQASVKSDLRNLNTAVQTYSATKKGKLPETCAEFTSMSSLVSLSAGNVVRFTERADGGYFLIASIESELNSAPNDRMFYRSDTGKMYSDRAALRDSFPTASAETAYLAGNIGEAYLYQTLGVRNCTM